MLSKRQAKLFFIGGTAFFALIFLGLSIDSLLHGIPKNTHSENITEQVANGKYLWEKSNCMGCHTIMGEGAYYAPELTRAYQRRGPDYIRTVLNFPGGWRPHGRRMYQYKFSAEEKEDLVAFLRWVGDMQLNGFPPEPALKKKR